MFSEGTGSYFLKSATLIRNNSFRICCKYSITVRFRYVIWFQQKNIIVASFFGKILKQNKILYPFDHNTIIPKFAVPVV
jgi:hypothetical protein